MTTNARRAPGAHYYDDPDFNYARWWRGRTYEHRAEVLAIRRLLAGRRFGRAVDVGGGYGRLSVVLANYADCVTLVDPSRQQLGLSEGFLARHPAIDRRQMAATDLDFPTASVDLVTMIRVMHHLPDPAPAFAEVARILRPGGLAIIEAANSRHAVNRVRYLRRGEQIPVSAVDLRSHEARRRGAVPYMNHNPATVITQIRAAGLRVRRMLSVSNLRHPGIKDVLPERVMLAMERAAQRPLAGIHFGPSMFFLAEK
ncbi:MAG TPA: class I SAM-dependent methyltransferase [Streptosporangiaceae bacterium]|nr:class I SAM-dependent methyltransferase [Streptosporangiaceae bacterium]